MQKAEQRRPMQTPLPVQRHMVRAIQSPNPLHNGHLYQIQQVRKNGAEAIVAVMSGNFMQQFQISALTSE